MFSLLQNTKSLVVLHGSSAQTFFTCRGKRSTVIVRFLEDGSPRCPQAFSLTSVFFPPAFVVSTDDAPATRRSQNRGINEEIRCKKGNCKLSTSKYISEATNKKGFSSTKRPQPCTLRERCRQRRKTHRTITNRSDKAGVLHTFAHHCVIVGVVWELCSSYIMVV